MNGIKSEEKYTAKDIKELLEKRFSDKRHYTFADEVGDSTGISQTRRLDFCVIDHFESNGFSIDTFEIKVSKGDLMSELRNPDKHNIFFDNINTYSLACPHYILDKKTMEIIPPKWGVYTVKDGLLRAKRKPVPLHDEKVEKIDKSFVASFIRRINKPTVKDYEQKLIERYYEGIEEGKKKERKHQAEMEKINVYSRDAQYIACYKELLTILDTQHYKLKDAIPVIRLILKTDTGYLKSYLEDTINNLNKLNDMLGDDIDTKMKIDSQN